MRRPGSNGKRHMPGWPLFHGVGPEGIFRQIFKQKNGGLSQCVVESAQFAVRAGG